MTSSLEKLINNKYTYLLSTRHFDGLSYKKNWLMPDIGIYHEQNTLMRWGLAIGTNILYLDNCTDILHLDKDTDILYSNNDKIIKMAQLFYSNLFAELLPLKLFFNNSSF